MRRATSRHRRIGVIAALSWGLAVVVTATIAERAVAVLEASSPHVDVLSQAAVVGALATARATALAIPTVAPSGPVPSADASEGASPTPSAPPSAVEPSVPPTSPPTVAPTAPEVARTWTVTGGTVAAACRDAAVSLLYATPQDGWTVDIGSTGPGRVEVELKSPDQETSVTAVCVGGVPQRTVGRSSGAEDSGGRE